MYYFYFRDLKYGTLSLAVSAYKERFLHHDGFLFSGVGVFLTENDELALIQCGIHRLDDFSFSSLIRLDDFVIFCVIGGVL